MWTRTPQQKIMWKNTKTKVLKQNVINGNNTHVQYTRTHRNMKEYVFTHYRQFLFMRKYWCKQHGFSAIYRNVSVRWKCFVNLVTSDREHWVTCMNSLYSIRLSSLFIHSDWEVLRMELSFFNIVWRRMSLVPPPRKALFRTYDTWSAVTLTRITALFICPIWRGAAPPMMHWGRAVL